MGTVLIVEDMKLFGNMLVRDIQGKTPHSVVWVQTMAEAEAVLDAGEHAFFLALLDLTLPDALDGEIVDLALSRGLTSVVFTATLEDSVREDMWAKNIADYVYKDHVNNLEYIVESVKRLHDNQDISILVADDSRAQRSHMVKLLKVHRYQVLEAANGHEALGILEQRPDISLVIADYNMPKMNGHELTLRIREQYSRDELAIIGVSSLDNRTMSARFIKSGANDFLTKPFISEEFYCRVGLNVELMQSVARIREASNKDFLTALWNRRYFFEKGNDLFQECCQVGWALFTAMIDIDHFKHINDTHGHEVGDTVLVHLAKALEKNFQKEGIVARFGGEEFCILGNSGTDKNLRERFEYFREHMAATPVETAAGRVSFTISIGICPIRLESLHAMLVSADESLYQAKEQGRNKVVISG